MIWTRRLFWFAGIYGFIVLAPQYLMERRIGIDFPPEITHPEYFYGFVGVALAWQVAFLIIGTDPLRYRPMIIPSVIEKFSFAGAAAVLLAQGRVPRLTCAFAGIDFILGVLFLISFARLPSWAAETNARK
jgi:hypothetical protein